MHEEYNNNMQFNGQIFKFILNIKIYEKFVEFLSKLIWRETLFLNNLSIHLNLDPFGMSMVSDDKMVFMVCVCLSLSLFGLVVSKISLNQLILFELGLVWLMGCNHFVKRLKPNKKIQTFTFHVIEIHGAKEKNLYETGVCA